MPWVSVTIWHGTSDEALELIQAIEHNCPNRPPCQGCDAHRGMLDQRWLDTMLFLRWMRERLLKEEGICTSRRLARTRLPSAG